MKAMTVARRATTGLLPGSIRRLIGIGRPNKQAGPIDLSRENYVVDLLEIDPSAPRKTFMDFGCGLMRIGKTGRVNAYYVDTVLSPYADEICDRRSIGALMAFDEAGFRIDGIVCFAAIQYCTRNEVAGFFDCASRIVRAGGLVFLEVDGRDLMGARASTDEARYKNDYDKVERVVSRTVLRYPRAGRSLLKYLRKSNLYVNCLRYSDYRAIFSARFEVTRLQTRSAQTHWNWLDASDVKDDELLYRIWLKPRST
jgi:hypothetical protein